MGGTPVRLGEDVIFFVDAIFAAGPAIFKFAGVFNVGGATISSAKQQNGK